MGDLRFLDVLNRKERKAYEKQMKGQNTMLVNLNTNVEAYEVDDTLIKNAKNNIPTVKDLCMRALRQVHADDQKDNLQIKQIRYNLLKRITNSDEIELTDSEREILCNRIGKVFLQIELVGRACELINGTVEEKKESKAPEVAPPAVQPDAAPTQQ
jgi:hypothetical protein